MEYFYEKDLSALKDWLVLLDYEGTLVAPGTTIVSEETKTALASLATRNEVVICSNRPPVEGFEATFGIQWPVLQYAKPDPKSVHSIIAHAQKRVVIVGDTVKTDGALARALDVPFIPVATLGKPREKTTIVAYDQLPAVLLPETRESVAILVSGKAPFFHHLTLDIRNRELLRRAEHLARALTDMKVQVCIDPSHLGGFQSVVVLGDNPDALNDALLAKQKGFIRSIVVGPYLPLSTPEHRSRVQHEAIDAIFVLSEVVRKQVITLDQYFVRAQVWNVGLPKTIHRRLPASHTPECELVVLSLEEKAFKTLIDVLWRFGVSLSVVAQSNTFSKIKNWIQARRKVSWRLIAGTGDYLARAEEAWMSDLPTLIVAPEEPGVVLPEQCGMRIDSVEQLESALPDLLESLTGYEPLSYANIHCSTESRARELIALLRALPAEQ